MPQASPPRLTVESPGTLLLGGARVALFDIEEGIWSAYRQLEALVGRSLADSLAQQAGANGGAAFARALLASGPFENSRQAFLDCLDAYQGAGFGRFEVVSLRWPIGRAVIRAEDTFESWMTRRHGQQVGSPTCSYTAGALVGLVNVASGRRDIVCVERACQSRGAPSCLFEILPAGPASGARPVGVDPDPALSYQLNLLHILFDRMPMGVAVFDRNLILRRCNPTWGEYIRRYSPRRTVRVLPGLSLFELVPESRVHLGPLFDQALAGETVRRDAVRLVSGGIVSYWDLVLTPLVRYGKVVGVVEVATDATERVTAYQSLEERVAERTRELARRRQVAEALRETLAVLNSRRSLAEILDHLVAQAASLLGADAVAVWRVEPGGGDLAVQASRGLPDGYAENVRVPLGEGAVGRAAVTREPVAVPDRLAGPPVSSAVTRPEVRRFLEEARGRLRSCLAVPLVVKDEAYGSICLYYRRTRQFDRDEVELASSFADQAALAIENARLRAEAEQAAAAAERNRLARELHDAVTQTLFSANLIAEVLPRIWARDPEQGHARLAELRQLTQGALAEMRTLLLELRPSALTEADLAEVLRQLCQATGGRARLPVELEVVGDGQPPPETRVAFYRIAQEALNNVAKHSGATQAHVRLELGPRGASLTVADDGRGFDPAAVAPGRLGLGIMRERAESVGARLQIDSRPGAGTRVVVTWTTPETGEEGEPDERDRTHPRPGG